MNWPITRLFSRNGNGKPRINGHGLNDEKVSRALAQLSAPQQQTGIRVSNLQSLEYALTSSGLGWASDHRRESKQYVGWHYVAIRTIAQQVGQADVNAYRRLASLESIKLSYNWESDDSEPLPWDHALMKFLRRPNPQQSGAMFRFDCVLQLKLTGKLLIWNMRNQFGKVVRRYVIPTAIVEPRMPTPQYPEGYYRVKPELARLGAQGGWFFAGNYLPSVGWDIDSREIQVILDPHPIYRDDGQSPIAASAQWTDQANEIDNARSSHMRHGPDSNLHVHINADMDEGDLARAEAKFNRKYVGTDRAGRAIFTAGENSGVEVTPLTFHPHEMEYTESFTQMRDAILALHGVPPLAAGVEQASGGESLYAPLKQFIFFVVQPMLDMFAEEDNEAWVWQYGENGDRGTDLYIEYTARSIDNPDEEMGEANLLVSAKAITVGELRTRFGLEKFGDERDDELVGGSAPQPGAPGMPGMMPPMPPGQNPEDNLPGQQAGSDEEAKPPIPFEPSMKGWLSYADEVYRSAKSGCGAGKEGDPGFEEGNTCASGNGSGGGGGAEDPFDLSQGDFNVDAAKKLMNKLGAFLALGGTATYSEAHKVVDDISSPVEGEQPDAEGPGGEAKPQAKPPFKDDDFMPDTPPIKTPEEADAYLNSEWESVRGEIDQLVQSGQLLQNVRHGNDEKMSMYINEFGPNSFASLVDQLGLSGAHDKVNEWYQKEGIGVQPARDLEMPEKWAPIRNDDMDVEAYKKTSAVVKAIQYTRSVHYFKKYGLDPAEISEFQLHMWVGWLVSSSSRGGAMIKEAAVQEFGAMRRAHEYPFENNKERLKAIASIRATWEASQYAMEKAGIKELTLWRGLVFDENKLPKVMDGEKLPGLKLKRSAAQSFSANPDIANNWEGLEGIEPGQKRVVLRARIPRSAVLSIPTMGENTMGEREVVVMGTRNWRAWEAWLDRAPGDDMEPDNGN